MRRLSFIVLAALPALGLAQNRVEDWKFTDRETIQRSFSAGPGAKLRVDNVWGYVHVTGSSGSQVQATVQKRIYAETSEALERAKREVTLDISQQGDTVSVSVTGPFRTPGGGVKDSGDRKRGYRVIYDCDFQVPSATDLALKNVADVIEVRNTTGKFDLRGVNGGITMEDVSGSGAANTVNGRVKVTFAKNPESASEFHTVNGPVDVYFRPGLNADVVYKTLNGGVFSDFDFTPQSSGGAAQGNNARFVYRSGGSGSARIGAGGARLQFNTINGPVRLHSKN
jgi:hypothetical protein